jgi:diacylglycerol O-acyltransferase
VGVRRLSGLDTAFLAAERPGNLLHVMGIVVLDPTSVPGGYSFEGLRAFLEKRLHRVPPLRRRVVEVPGGLARPFWVEEPGLDLDLHLRRAAVPSPGGPRELAAMAAEIHARPLDRSRPLWEIHAVEGLEGGRVAILGKLHHATMDGMAGMRYMASLFSDTAELMEPPPAEAIEPERVPGRIELLGGSVPWLLGQPLRVARAAALSARTRLRGAWRLGRAPERAPGPSASRTFLNAPTTPHRSVAWLALPLGELREVAREAGATLNDVLLASIGGALRAYLASSGVLPRVPLVAAVPVATRSEGDDRANALTMSTVSLATDVADPAGRLRVIRRATTASKAGRSRGGADELAVWADVPPPLVMSLAARAYLGLGLADRLPPVCNLLVSSVPGPTVPLYFAGARIVGIHPLGPIYTGMTLNVTAVGGGESLDLGIVGDRGQLPDLWELADAIPAALAELRAVVRQRAARRRARARSE